MFLFEFYRESFLDPRVKLILTDFLIVSLLPYIEIQFYFISISDWTFFTEFSNLFCFEN